MTKRVQPEPSEAEITLQLRAWRAGFSDIAIGNKFHRSAIAIAEIRATALFIRDPGWTLCGGESGSMADLRCGCWEQPYPEDHCTNELTKARVAAAIAAASPEGPFLNPAWSAARTRRGVTTPAADA
jgi:hypothetical protein